MEALSEEVLSQVCRAIQNDVDRELLRLIHELKIEQYNENASAGTLEIAADLGWIKFEDGTTVLTRAGEIAGDPIREYIFWIERGRTVHMADSLECFAAEAFDGQKVLEIGSGFGCNLFSIAEYADEAVGVDLEPQYAQFTPVFAELEGTTPPKIHVGPAEKLPFTDGYFDQVLILGSLQYMDISVALSEAARVLRPGGVFITVQGSFGQYLLGSFLNWSHRKRLRTLKTDLITLMETLTYEFLGRRFQSRWEHSTAKPIYPTRRFMRKSMQKCGMVYDRDNSVAFDMETKFQAVRGSANS